MYLIALIILKEEEPVGKLLKAEGDRQGSVGNSSNRLNSSAGFFSGYLALMIMVIGCYILQPIVDLTGPQ